MKSISKKPLLFLYLLIFVFFNIHEIAAKSNSIDLSFSINCPPNVTIGCSSNIYNLSIYGNATYTSGYNNHSAGSPVVTYYINSCNTGYITRTWTVEDNYWRNQSCTQTIFVGSIGAASLDIKWPEDIELEGCNPNTHPSKFAPGYDYPTHNYLSCSMIGKSYFDMYFTINSQCSKIIRTWRIMDWCNYNPYTNLGIWSHQQVIKIYSSAIPQVNCLADITANSYNCVDVEVIVPSLIVESSSCGGDFEVTHNSVYAIKPGNNISGKYPIGTTKVTYTIRYGCGLIKYCYTNVNVISAGSRPSVYCLGSLTTALMPIDANNDGIHEDGMVQIWAKDLDKGSKSNCGVFPLKYSFSKNVNETSKTFTCAQVGKNEIEMWVTDSRGFQAFCMVEIVIQNNGANIPNCQPNPNPPVTPPVAPPDTLYKLKGTIKSAFGKALANAGIELKYKDAVKTYTSKFDTIEIIEIDSFINFSGYKLFRYNKVLKITETKDSSIQFVTHNVKSGQTGSFDLTGIPLKKRAFSVSAAYSDSIKSGIDSKDIEILTKYLLGDLSFNSIQQFLAADVNEDGKINLEDLNILMELITNQRQSLPGLNQWYVFDKSFSLNDPSKVFSSKLPLQIEFDSIATTNKLIEFVAIKKGDINNSVGSNIVNNVQLRNVEVNESKLEIFPNPFTSIVNIRLENSKEDKATIRFYNLGGQLLRSFDREILRGSNDLRFELDPNFNGLVLYKVNLSDRQLTGLISKLTE